MKQFSLIFISLIFCGQLTNAQVIIFNTTPEWISIAQGRYATGLGIADINGDEWDDIIVANGNDILRQPVSVYYNNGDGTFPTLPSWNSSDVDYHGHLSVGDINGDNLPDVAVSIFLGPGSFSEPGGVKVYLNTGSSLESVPSYRTADSVFTFSCALGDADGDGDLDLAVAGGQPYNLGVGPYTTYGRIYYNQNGSLETLPGWLSQELMGAMDVDFADMDRNGFLDVIFASHLTPNYLYLADSRGQISTQHSWNSQDADYHANSLTVARMDGNDYLDLIISDNDQLGGQGKYKAYLFNAPPSGQSSPGWYSTTGGYGSAVFAEDLTLDGNPDLLAGRWWGQVEMYVGIPNSLTPNPVWASGTTSVIEAFELRDLDQDGRMVGRDTINISIDSVHVVYLRHSGVEKINSVFLNGQPFFAGTDYCNVPGRQWLSFKVPLFNGDQLIVIYDISIDRDLTVTNWDPDIGNYLFYNQTNPSTGIAVQPAKTPGEFELFQNYPNPFNPTTKIGYRISDIGFTELKIYDMLGRAVKTLVNQELLPGNYMVEWDGTDNSVQQVPGGFYFYRLRTGSSEKTRRMLLIK
jgi:hypothetical protein